jgi:Glycosyltransferases involved in cell wall biogenesis
MPLFSVVIPLYNKEPHVKRTLNSVLAQTIQDFEIIVVDDGSTDKSKEVVKSFSDYRIQLISQKNAGVSVARNRGINEAKADFIAFLDADDEWKPNFLEEIFGLINKYPSAGAYAVAYNICLPYGKIRIARYKAIPLAPWKGLLPSYFLAAATGEHPVCSSSICIPKHIFSDIGGFKVGAWWGEDDDMWGRIAIKYPIAFSWEIGCIVHKETINRACSRLQTVEEHPFIRTAQKLMNEDKVPANMLNDLRECIAKYQILSAAHNISVGNPRLARDILSNCETKLLYHQEIFWSFWAIMPSPIYHTASKTRGNLSKLFSWSSVKR